MGMTRNPFWIIINTNSTHHASRQISAPGWVIFFTEMIMAMTTAFDKPPLSIEAQLQLLKNRGLIIENDEQAKFYLKHIGYYRLRGYFTPFYNAGDDNHGFVADSTFETILDHYTFDRELRLLVLDAIERLEVALKAAISDTMSINAGAHWYLKEEHFQYGKRFAHIDYLITLKEDLTKHNKTLILKHYFENYQTPEFPPSWVLFQILSLGFVSRFYKNLKTEHRKSIATGFNLDHTLLESWFGSLTVTRNICAHHSRLYNLSFSTSPTIAKEHKDFLERSGKFYAQAVIIFALLGRITEQSDWALKLKTLLEKYPNVPLAWMGFPEDWQKVPFWCLATN